MHSFGGDEIFLSSIRSLQYLTNSKAISPSNLTGHARKEMKISFVRELCQSMRSRQRIAVVNRITVVPFLLDEQVTQSIVQNIAISLKQR